MADQEIPLSRKLADPTLKDLLDLHKKDILLSMNCHAIAKIQSFDATKQTVTATIMYKKTFFQRQSDATYTPVLVDYPLLVDVPVLVLGGGGFSVTFPIAEGDEALILFNDRDIDNWFQGSTNGAVASSRMHSFSDGIALVGMRSLANSISGYDTTRAVLRADTPGAYVGVSATKVKVANQTTTLNTLLGQLIDAIVALSTTNATVGAPVALSPATIAALNTIKTQIAGLLE